MLTILLNLVCIAFGLLIEYEYLMSQDGIYCSVYLPSLGTLLLFMQLVYWSTLFESFSFYVTLLIQSIKDIIAFMIILMIILVAFSICVTVINKNYKRSHQYLFEKNELDSEYHDLITTRFGEEFTDALYVQWLLGLGEFEMLGATDEGEKANESVKVIMWILFILATLIS